MGDKRGCDLGLEGGAKKAMSKTIFQKIIDRELPAEILYEDEEVICIKDKFPQAKVHLLLITKKCILSIHEVEENDYPLVIKMFKVAKQVAKECGIENAYRLVINRGSHAGQTVFHLHMHLLGGERLHAKMD